MWLPEVCVHEALLLMFWMLPSPGFHFYLHTFSFVFHLMYLSSGVRSADVQIVHIYGTFARNPCSSALMLYCITEVVKIYMYIGGNVELLLVDSEFGEDEIKFSRWW